MIVMLLTMVVLLLVGAAAAVAVGRIDLGGVPEPVSTEPIIDLGDGPVTGRDVDAVRFDQTIRGYRMAQVDSVLIRVQRELDARDEAIRRLGGDEDFVRRVLAEREQAHATGAGEAPQYDSTDPVKAMAASDEERAPRGAAPAESDKEPRDSD